jgi:hypothetical protein
MRHKKVGLGLALLVLLLSAVLGATVLREPIAYAASPFQSVIVANTNDQPVPVKQQGTVPVTVGNPAAPAEPYLVAIHCGTSVETDACTEVHDTPIPDGKRFVIQSVAGSGNADVGDALVNFNLAVQTNGVGGNFALGGGAYRTDQFHTYSNAEARQVTLYADGGTRLFFGVLASADTHISATLYVSGYLVPMP